MGFSMPKAMSGSRFNSLSARLLGPLALLVILLLVACGGEAIPTPTATPTLEPTAAPTATPTPEPTPTPDLTETVTPADVEAVLASVDVTWRELFDILGADEQECIRQNLGEGLDEVLDSKALADESTEDHVVIMRCLPPDLADSVFLANLLLSFGFARQVTTEERLCLEDLVESEDSVALAELLVTNASSAQAASFTGKIFKCTPDLLIAEVVHDAGARILST